MADEKKTKVKKVEEAVEADISILFTEETTDDVKERIKTIFDAAVEVKAQKLDEARQEQIDEMVAEQLAEAVEELEESFDRYVSYVAEKWLEDNEIAVESSMKVEIAESLMEGLVDLVSTHNIDLPDDAEGVLEGLMARNEELKEQLNEQTQTVILLQEKDELREVQDILASASKGLPDTKASKLKELAENVKYSDAADFSKKLDGLKQTLFKEPVVDQNKDPVDGGPLDEDTKGKDTKPVNPDPMVQHVLEGFNRFL